MAHDFGRAFFAGDDSKTNTRKGEIREEKMREPKNNIRLVHPECSPIPNPELAAKGAKYFLGKTVKKRFAREHMWVRIDGLKGNVLTGILYNDPIMTALKLGDRVEVRLNEIEEVCEI